jgi:hypothetical protein
VAKRAREHVECTECGWVGVTPQGRVRQGLFLVSLAAVAVLVALELAGVTELGDDLWGICVTVMLVSIGGRLLVRGDRCRTCGGRAVYVKRGE